MYPDVETRKCLTPIGPLAIEKQKKKLPGSQGRKPYDWKTIQKSNTIVKEWYFKNRVGETYEVTPPEKLREAVSYDRPVRYIHSSTTLRVPSSRSLLPVTGLELVLMVWLHAKWTSLNVSS